MLWSTKIELAKNVRKEANGLLDLGDRETSKEPEHLLASHSI